MIGEAYASQAELVVGCGSLDRKVLVNQTVRETEAKLVHHPGGNGVVVGNYQTAVVLTIDVVWQQGIGWAGLAYVCEQVLPTEAGIDLLRGSEIVVDPDVPAVGAPGCGLQRFIIVASPWNIDVGRG